MHGPNDLNQQNQSLILFSLIGVTTFNIHATIIIIHAILQIPKKKMNCLEEHSLITLKEELNHVCYILIHKIKFIGPKLSPIIITQLSPWTLFSHNKVATLPNLLFENFS
jgi:hypothetical protein